MSLDEMNNRKQAAKTRLSLSAQKLLSLDEQSSKQEILLNIDQFEQKLKIYDEVQDTIETLTKDADIASIVEQSESYREESLSSLVRAKNLLDAKNTLSFQHNDLSSAASASNPSKLAQAKLPRLQLPHFTGDYTQW